MIFACCDCQVDTSQGNGIGEIYMVRDALWELVTVNTPANLLCIECLETRAGRSLDLHDFAPLAINSCPDIDRSTLLTQRLEGFAQRYGEAAQRSKTEIDAKNVIVLAALRRVTSVDTLRL